jgi:hypothetical protein
MLRMSPKAKHFMNMPAVAQGFGKRVEGYEADAATAATELSRRLSRRFSSNRPLAPARPGRPTTDGMFANFINWQRGANGLIQFDYQYLDTAAPYWIILEVGTGTGGFTARDARGNPVLTGGVKSQKGRHIPWNLYWADGPGAAPTRRMSGKKRKLTSTGNQQLYPVDMLPAGTSKPGSGGIIRREIKGKHYVQDGGIEGFRMLSNEILSDARKTFKRFS